MFHNSLDTVYKACKIGRALSQRLMKIVATHLFKFSVAAVVVASLTLTTSARADLVISSGTTTNVACGSGTCTATAQNAVLNADTLQSRLASSNITVTTGSIANRLVIDAPLSWSSTTTLTLHARQQVAVEALVTVLGLGGLTLSTGDETGFGNLAYAPPGRVAFKNTLSKLTINGLRYKLVTNIAGLAAAAAANPIDRIALADNYDAKPDGIYNYKMPVTIFNGLFEGLGNSISNLAVIPDGTGTSDGPAGLFGTFGKGCQKCGRINGIALADAVIYGYGTKPVGGLVGVLSADVVQSSVTGTIAGGYNAVIGGLVGMTSQPAKVLQSWANVRTEAANGIVAGGLIGDNQGTIALSYALSQVVGGRQSTVGGLVGSNEGTIETSFAAGSAVSHGAGSINGGLVGKNSEVIENCYATAAVTRTIPAGGRSGNAYVGGLVGLSKAARTTSSYAAGFISDAEPKDSPGGFVGFIVSGGMKNDYWDVSTSGIASSSDGAGNTLDEPGISAVTSEQLGARLLRGFSAAIWTHNPSINNGLPYLIANPPPK